MIKDDNMIFLIDFDNTISKQCSFATLVENFVMSDISQLNNTWQFGKISTPDATDIIVKHLNMSEDNLLEVMNKIDLDPYVDDFFNYCERKNFGYAIVSDGFQSIIHSILSKHQLINNNRHIKIYANLLEQIAGKWRASYPYRNELSSPLLGVSKIDIVRKYQEKDTVCFIGDGYTDYLAASAANHVFAKDKLAQYCQTEAIPYQHYDSFQDILDHCHKQTCK